MANKKVLNDAEETKTESEFSKEQLLASKKFEERRDVLNALLFSDKTYTASAVEKMIEDFMKGTVK